jgi:hypothetical protein
MSFDLFVFIRMLIIQCFSIPLFRNRADRLLMLTQNVV